MIWRRAPCTIISKTLDSKNDCVYRPLTYTIKDRCDLLWLLSKRHACPASAHIFNRTLANRHGAKHTPSLRSCVLGCFCWAPTTTSLQPITAANVRPCKVHLQMKTPRITTAQTRTIPRRLRPAPAARNRPAIATASSNRTIPRPKPTPSRGPRQASFFTHHNSCPLHRLPPPPQALHRTHRQETGSMDDRPRSPSTSYIVHS